MSKKIWRGHAYGATGNQHVQEDPPHNADTNATVVPDAARFPVKEGRELCMAAIDYHLTGPFRPNLLKIIERYECAADKYLRAIERMKKKESKKCAQK